MKTTSTFLPLLLLLVSSLPSGSLAQTSDSRFTPIIGLKTNILYDATTTLNLGLEIGLGHKTTLDISGSYNPWVFNDDMKFKLWLVQPEVRYWFDKRFSGHFLGGHLHYGQYNVHGIGLFSTQTSNKQGDLWGAGFSYGYQWRLANRWSIEASLGLGYARLRYDVYDCKQCGKRVGTEYKNYWGPTKVAVSLIYVFK